MGNRSYNGAFTALVTIFDSQNQIDYKSMLDLIEFQIQSGINGLLVCGSTGETATLSDSERLELVKFVVNAVAKRVPVMAGLNFNSTGYAVDQAKLYSSHGVDLLLVNNPSYNKPSEEGMFEHFKHIANAIPEMPMLIYNIPSRSIFNLSEKLLVRSFNEISNIIGMKDSSGAVNGPYFLQKNVKKKLYFLGGDDDIAPFYCVNGGCGVISVLSNVFPKEITMLYDSLGNEDYKNAFLIHRKFMDLYRAIFIETNPVPIKYALRISRGYSDVVRLPLLQLSESSKSIIEEALKFCYFYKEKYYL